ncbi:uracil-DNA glycosylase [Gordonia sp. YY1]|uniref:uracil-DNA glycosylase n=1 Tax=Gordonia sp. YY1 TaxID=396712 RepID=UPI00133143A0|nr:uracil-DNA glycosylase [Gordonia sp. YY1]KAF0969887.1 hypothetical protein BPODLACK_01576 [Gordonia sp. YY1]
MQWCSSRPYRDDLFRRRYEPHVARINKLVDRLRAEHPERFIPYVAPTYGGENARVLALLQDPGPKTNPENMNGSGMLCIENVDGSAERYKMFLAKYGIDVCDIQAWNAFPWYATTSQKYGSDGTASYSPADLDDATQALAELVYRLPRLRAVLLHGLVARDAWARLDALRPNLTEGVVPIPSWHTSPKVVDPATKSKAQIDRFTGELDKSFADAANVLRDPSQDYSAGPLVSYRTSLWDVGGTN